MVAPLILSDRGDIALFETVRDLERYVESPDADTYKVYDALGQRHFFKGQGVFPQSKAVVLGVRPLQLDEENPGPQEAEELMQLLRSYLKRVGNPGPVNSLPLDQLIQKTIEMCGYTR